MKKFTLALAALLTPVLLAAPAFASDFGEETGGGAGRLDAQLVPIKRAIGDLVDVMEQVFAIMTSNPLLLVLLAASLFSVGVWIFRKVKSAAK